MELIKKEIQRIMTTGSTTGCTDCFVFIPDLSVNYGVKIMLTGKNIDFGFFDTIELEDAYADGTITCEQLSASTSGNTICQTGSTFPTGATIGLTGYPVTGTTSSSRLSELRKFSVSGTLSELYFTSTDPNVADGVNELLTTTGVTWTYYLSGITYVDDVVNNITTFSFTSEGYGSPAFVNLPFIKDEAKQNIIDKPEIDNNVFIIRQSLPVFQNVYRLQDIRNISELEKYAGGAKFNIINNT